MPYTMSPEKEERLRLKIESGDYTDAEAEAWRVYQAQKPGPAPVPEEPPAMAPEAPALTLRPTFFPPEDARSQDPWWQQYFSSVGEQAQAPVSPLTGESLYVPGAKPGEQTDIGAEHSRTLRRIGAETVRQAPSIAMMATQPEAAPIKAFGADKLAYIVSEWGVPALRALGLTGIQEVAERFGNWLYPEDPSDPEIAARLTGGGQFVGEILAPRLGRLGHQARRPFAETPPSGPQHREVIERLGGEAPLPLQSQRFMGESIDVGLRHSPLGFQMRNVWNKAEEVIQRELGRLHAILPGTRLTETTDVLRALIRGEAREDLLERLPPVLRKTFATQLDEVQKSITRAYGDFDAHYLSQQVNWHPGRRRHYTPTLDALLHDPRFMRQMELDPGGRSIFAEVSRLLEALNNLPATISLDTAMDMQRVVKNTIADVAMLLAEPVPPGSPGELLRASVNDLVRPALGETLTELNHVIAPYLVDIRNAKEHARRLLADWERFQVSESALLRGQAGRQQMIEDPHIQFAKALTAKDAAGQDVINDFVSFLDAHQYRSKALEIARQPGPNLGNTIGRHGDRMAMALESQMRATGSRLDPTFLPHFARVQQQYAQAAEVWNSPYIMGKMQANLDDLLNGLIQAKRPNDMRTLRAVLGNETMDDAAAMWLTQRILDAKQQGPVSLNASKLLEELDQLGGQTERVLFPAGLSDVRKWLRQIVNMDAGFAEASKGALADARLLAKAKANVGDTALWQSVQADILAPMLQKKGTTIDGELMLSKLNALDKVQHVLFEPGVYDALLNFAQTAAAVQRSQTHHAFWWNPVVRASEHGIALWLATSLTGSPWVPAAYVVGVPALGWLMTNPRMVKLLTQGLTTPHNSRAGGAIAGALLGQLTAQGYRDYLQPLPPVEEGMALPDVTGR